MTARPLKVNFAINVLGAIIPLVVSLVTVPIYVRTIGNARYGIRAVQRSLLKTIASTVSRPPSAAANRS